MAVAGEVSLGMFNICISPQEVSNTVHQLIYVIFCCQMNMETNLIAMEFLLK